jgi:hypothetical protein
MSSNYNTPMIKPPPPPPEIEEPIMGNVIGNVYPEPMIGNPVPGYGYPGDPNYINNNPYINPNQNMNQIYPPQNFGQPGLNNQNYSDSGSESYSEDENGCYDSTNSAYNGNYPNNMNNQNYPPTTGVNPYQVNQSPYPTPPPPPPEYPSQTPPPQNSYYPPPLSNNYPTQDTVQQNQSQVPPYQTYNQNPPQNQYSQYPPQNNQYQQQPMYPPNPPLQENQNNINNTYSGGSNIYNNQINNNENMYSSQSNNIYGN